jgi:hypothetical protein
VHIGVPLLGCEVRHDLPELHAIALVDDYIADAPDEIEAKCYFTTTFDGRTPEHLADDVTAIDDVAAHGHRSNEAMPRDERDNDRDGQDL